MKTLILCLATLIMLLSPVASAQGIMSSWENGKPSRAYFTRLSKEFDSLSPLSPEYLNKLETLADFCKYFDKPQACNLWLQSANFRELTRSTNNDMYSLAHSWCELGTSYHGCKKYDSATRAYKRAIYWSRLTLKMIPRDPSLSREAMLTYEQFHLEQELYCLTMCHVDCNRPKEAMQTYNELVLVMLQPRDFRYDLQDLRQKMQKIGLKLPPEPKFPPGALIID